MIEWRVYIDFRVPNRFSLSSIAWKQELKVRLIYPSKSFCPSMSKNVFKLKHKCAPSKWDEFPMLHSR